MPAKKKSRSSKKPAAPVEMVVAPEVLEAVQQLRMRCDMMVTELGRLEVRKTAMVTEVNALNHKANTLLRQEGDRLGIPAGASWRVSPEGKALVDDPNASNAS